MGVRVGWGSLKFAPTPICNIFLLLLLLLPHAHLAHLAHYNPTSTQHTMNTQYNIPAHLLRPGDRTELVVFSFLIDGISAAGRALIDRAIEHPWLFGIEAGLIVGGILFLLLPVIIGFGSLGPVSGEP